MQAKPRCTVYIDGYNWYHAIFKENPQWKWLNIQSFLECIRPDDDVVAIKLFSAMVLNQDGCARQTAYFNALKTLPKLSVHLGLFQPRDVHCRATCGEPYRVPEEKKTDVNIAVEMISDAMDGLVDRICLITGDSDIEPAVKWISRRCSTVQTLVYVPCLPRDMRDRRIDHFKGVPRVGCAFLPIEGLDRHQLGPLIKYQSNPPMWTHRPSSWCVGGG